MPAPRATILDAAAKLFAAHGFEGASLNDVARAVGVTKAAVYHYFPTKKDIFDEMMIDLLERQYAAVSTEVAPMEMPASTTGRPGYSSSSQRHQSTTSRPSLTPKQI